MKINPYRSPEIAGVPACEATASPTRSRKAYVAIFAGIVAYHLWTFLVLSSTPADRKVGLLLLLNSPVLVGWGVATSMGKSSIAAPGSAHPRHADCDWSDILIQDIGDWQATVHFHGIILVVLFMLTGICRKYFWCSNLAVFATTTWSKRVAVGGAAKPTVTK